MAKDYRVEAYRWEGRWAHWNLKMADTISSPRAWVRWACTKYRTSPPRVLPLSQNSELSYYDSLNHSINIQPVHWNAATALHEAAHAIVFVACDDAWEDHGREWFGVYSWLLLKAKMWPPVALSASARADGLPWHPISPAQLRVLAKKIRE